MLTRIDARDCTFLRNKALGGHGGAVAVGLGCEVTMSHCVFESNEARTEGCGNEAWDHCGGGGAVSLKVCLSTLLSNAPFLKNHIPIVFVGSV